MNICNSSFYTFRLIYILYTIRPKKEIFYIFFMLYRTLKVQVKYDLCYTILVNTQASICLFVCLFVCFTPFFNRILVTQASFQGRTCTRLVQSTKDRTHAREVTGLEVIMSNYSTTTFTLYDKQNTRVCVEFNLNFKLTNRKHIFVMRQKVELTCVLHTL